MFQKSFAVRNEHQVSTAYYISLAPKEHTRLRRPAGSCFNQNSLAENFVIKIFSRKFFPKDCPSTIDLAKILAEISYLYIRSENMELN